MVLNNFVTSPPLNQPINIQNAPATGGDSSGNIPLPTSPGNLSGNSTSSAGSNNPQPQNVSNGGVPSWGNGGDGLAGWSENSLSPAQTNAQQSLSFTNLASPDEAAAIGNMPTNWSPNQASAAQLYSSPLAALTVLGQAGQASTTGAGLYNAGFAGAGLYNSGNVGIDTSQSNPILAAQLQQINQLNNISNGVGPSVAQQQAQLQGQQNVANQMAVLGSQRGSSNASLGQRQGQLAASNANQQAIQAGVLGRTQEELQAQNTLNQALLGTQGQVMQGAQAQAGLLQQTALANTGASNAQQQFNAGQANAMALQNANFGNSQEQFNAGAANQQSQFNTQQLNAMLTQQGAMNQQINLANQAAEQQTSLANLQSSQQTNLANLQAAQQTQGLNANEYNAYVQSLMALGNTNLQASENYAQLVAQQNEAFAALKSNKEINQMNNQMGLVGAGIAGGAALMGGALSASDVNLKTNIKSGTRDMKDFLSEMGRHFNKDSTFSLLTGNL